MNPKISIVVPVSLKGPIHHNLITWIQDPHLRGHELLLILDEGEDSGGSFENHPLVDQVMALRIKEVQLHRIRAGNPGGPRNLGLSLATGDWVFFWDADDAPSINSALSLIDQAHSTPADLAIGLAQRDTLEGIRIMTNSWAGIVRWPGIWRFAFRRSLATQIEFKHWKWCEDQDFLVKAMIRAQNIFRGDQIIYSYNQQSINSLTSKKSNSIYLLDFCQSLEETTKGSSGGLILLLFYVKTRLALIPYVGALSAISKIVGFVARHPTYLVPKLPRTLRLSSFGMDSHD